MWVEQRGQGLKRRGENWGAIPWAMPSGSRPQFPLRFLMARDLTQARTVSGISI